MNKLWLVSAAYGAPGNSCVQSGTTMAEDAANAAASVVSEYYLRNRGTPNAMLPIMGVHVIEIPRENIELALKALDEQRPAGPQGAAVLSLVRDPGTFAPDPAAFGDVPGDIGPAAE